MGEIIPIPYVCGFLNTLHQNVLVLSPILASLDSSNQYFQHFFVDFFHSIQIPTNCIHNGQLPSPHYLDKMQNIAPFVLSRKLFQKMFAAFHVFCTFASQSRVFLSQIFRCW